MHHRLKRCIITAFVVSLTPSALALEHYDSTSESVFARALLFGQRSAVETYIAEEKPNLDTPLRWSPDSPMRPLSLVLTQLHSQQRYRLHRSPPLEPPADEYELSYLLLRFNAQSVYQDPHWQEQSPLHMIMKLPDTQQVRLFPLLLRFHGEACLPLKDSNENTPLMLAQQQNSPLAPLLEKYKPTGLSDYQIRSAPFAYAKGERIYEALAKTQSLAEAVEKQDLKRIEYWLEQGVSPDTYHLHPNGIPLVYTLARHKGLEGLKYWQQYRANFRIRDLQGQQVLHHLVQFAPDGFAPQERLQFLLNAGADLHARDDEGQTPLAVAQKANQQIWVDLLVKAGAR